MGPHQTFKQTFPPLLDRIQCPNIACASTNKVVNTPKKKPTTLEPRRSPRFRTPTKNKDLPKKPVVTPSRRSFRLQNKCRFNFSTIADNPVVVSEEEGVGARGPIHSVVQSNAPSEVPRSEFESEEDWAFNNLLESTFQGDLSSSEASLQQEQTSEGDVVQNRPWEDLNFDNLVQKIVIIVLVNIVKVKRKKRLSLNIQRVNLDLDLILKKKRRLMRLEI